MQFGKLKLKRCRYGWMLFAGPHIGKCFELYGEYGESEVSMMRNFMRPGSTVIDVGANIGDMTLPMSMAVGEGGRVYAVESHPENFNVLCANLALNGVVNTRPINAFIASSANPETSSSVWGKFAYVSEKWSTPFLALDDIGLEACDLIKIDVDGNELEVLESGAMSIERFRPVLYFENDVQSRSAAVCDYAMRVLGYDLYYHAAPINDPNNFFGNPENFWAPATMVSKMMVGLPKERKASMEGLKRMEHKDEWWDF